MAYFNYHAVAKKLIISGHCRYAKLVEKHNQISPALVLFFDNHPPLPIRENRFEEYFELLNAQKINVLLEIN